MGNFFNNGSMTMTFHILKVLHDLESHANDGRCGSSRNRDIRRFVGKLLEKQTLESQKTIGKGDVSVGVDGELS